MHFGLRFDFRNPDFADTSMADRYAAALEMAEWADRSGCTTIAAYAPLGRRACQDSVGQVAHRGKDRYPIAPR